MNKRPPLRRSAPVEQENDGIIEGRNAVTEALRAGVTIDKIFIAKGETDAALRERMSREAQLSSERFSAEAFGAAVAALYVSVQKEAMPAVSGER